MLVGIARAGQSCHKLIDTLRIHYIFYATLYYISSYSYFHCVNRERERERVFIKKAALEDREILVEVNEFGNLCSEIYVGYFCLTV